MLVTLVLAALTLVSVALLLWQCAAAWRFPLHRRAANEGFQPAITLLKPLKGANEHTAHCLESWMTQSYGAVQLLFGVADATDPACEIVRDLLRRFPNIDAELVITGESPGPNAKVSTLVQLTRRANHDVLCVSDADVCLSTKGFLESAVAPLRDNDVGLVNSLYQLANPTTLAMKWEAIAVNADFWSQVLQSNSMKRQDFALGAVMITRRDLLTRIGGFEALLEYLADDFELGHRIAATGARIELTPAVVECRDRPMNFREVWNHQVRWARTIRACQPLPYFFSILSNVTLWALLLALFGVAGEIAVLGVTDKGALYLPFWRNAVTSESRYFIETGYQTTLLAGLAAMLLRMVLGCALAVRFTRRKSYFDLCWLVPIKDLLQVGVWFAAFVGNTVEWGGRKFRVQRGGKLMPL